MLPTPAKTGPGGALSINIDNDSMGDLGKAFGNALKPLVKGINNLNATMMKAMAPDPESKTDRGKDLIKKDGGPDNKEKMSFGKLGTAAFLVLASYLTGFHNTLQGIVNATKIGSITKSIKKPFLAMGRGLTNLKGLFVNFGKSLKDMKLRAVFGKAGVFERFFLMIANIGKNIGDLASKAKSSFQGFFKGGILSKFFGAIGGFVDKVKSFNPATLKLQAVFGKGGVIGKFLLGFKKVSDGIKGFLTPIFSFGKSIVGGVTGILKGMKPFASLIGKILRFAGKIPVIGTLISVIFAVIDGITGFIEGFKDKGFIDGIFTAIGNILGGFFGSVGDLVKDLIAFLLEKIGFKDAAKALKSFSFKEIIKNAFGGIVNFFLNLPSIIEGAIRSLPGGDTIADFFLGKTKSAEIGKAQEEIKDIDEKIAEKRANKQGFDRNPFVTKKTFAEIEADMAAGRDVSKKDREFFEESKKEIDALELQKKGQIGKSLALKTKGLNLGAKKAAGMSTADVIKQNAAVLKDLTPEERDQLIKDLDTSSPQALKTQAQTDAVMAAEATSKDPLTDEQRADIKSKARDDFDKRVKRTIVPKAKAVPTPPLEGEALDEISSQVMNNVSAPSQVDNSQADNSTTNNSSNITNNHYGGGDSDSLNSRNPDHSLHSQHTTYANAT